MFKYWLKMWPSHLYWAPEHGQWREVSGIDRTGLVLLLGIFISSNYER